MNEINNVLLYTIHRFIEGTMLLIIIATALYKHRLGVYRVYFYQS